MRPVTVLVLVAFSVSGCASDDRSWKKVSGPQPSPEQFQLDRTACKGESQKVNASGTVINGGLASVIRRNEALDDVFVGCMASRGYLVSPQDAPKQ